MEFLKANDDGTFSIQENAKMMLEPEFQAMTTLKYNKGFQGDAGGRKRLRCIANLKFIFLYMDVRSQIAYYDKKVREKVAAERAGLGNDFNYRKDEYLAAAMLKYYELQISADVFAQAIIAARMLHKKAILFVQAKSPRDAEACGGNWLSVLWREY